MHGTGKANYFLLTGGAGENVVETEFERESRQDTADNLYKLYRRPNNQHGVDHYLDQLNDDFDEADLHPLLPATHENAEFIRYYGVHTNFRNGPAALYSQGDVFPVTLEGITGLQQGAGVVTFQVIAAIADGNFEVNDDVAYNLFQSNFSKRRTTGQRRQGIQHGGDDTPDTYIMDFQGTDVQFANAVVNGYVKQTNRVAYTYGENNAQHVYRFREYGGNHGKVTQVNPENDHHRLTVKIEGYGYLLPYDGDRQRTMGSTLKKLNTGGAEQQQHFTYASLRDQMRQPVARDLLTMYKYCAVDPDQDLDITKRVKYGNSLPFRKYHPGQYRKQDGETEQAFMERIQNQQEEENETEEEYQGRRIASLEGAYQLLTGNNDEDEVGENGAPICNRLTELVPPDNSPQEEDENDDEYEDRITRWNDNRHQQTLAMKLYAKSWKYCGIEDDLHEAWNNGVTTCPKYTRILEEAHAQANLGVGVTRQVGESEEDYTQRVRNSAIRWSDQQPTANMFQKQYGKRKAQEQSEILNLDGNTRTGMNEMVSVNQRAYQKRLKTVQGRKELDGGERYLSQSNIRRLVAGGIYNLTHRKVDFDFPHVENPTVTAFAANGDDPIITNPNITAGNGVYQYLITLADVGNLRVGDYVHVVPTLGAGQEQQQYGYISEIDDIDSQIKFLTTNEINALDVTLQLVPNTTVAPPCDIQEVLENRVELGTGAEIAVAQLSNKYNSSAKYWLSSGNTNGTYGVPALCAGAKIYRKGATRPSKKVKDKGKQKQCRDLLGRLQTEGDDAVEGWERLKLIMQFKLRDCQGDGNDLYKKKDFRLFSRPARQMIHHHLRTYNIFEALDRVVMSDAKHTARDHPTPLELIIAANITPGANRNNEGRVVVPEDEEMDIMQYRREFYNDLNDNVQPLIDLLASDAWDGYAANEKITRYKQRIQGLMTPNTISVIQKDIEDYIIECLKRGKQRAQLDKREQVFGSDILDPEMQHIYKIFRPRGFVPLDIENLGGVLGFDLDALGDDIGSEMSLQDNPPEGEDGQNLDQYQYDNFW